MSQLYDQQSKSVRIRVILARILLMMKNLLNFGIAGSVGSTSEFDKPIPTQDNNAVVLATVLGVVGGMVVVGTILAVVFKSKIALLLSKSTAAAVAPGNET
jgi:hypothetical protein